MFYLILLDGNKAIISFKVTISCEKPSQGPVAPAPALGQTFTVTAHVCQVDARQVRWCHVNGGLGIFGRGMWTMNWRWWSKDFKIVDVRRLADLKRKATKRLGWYNLNYKSWCRCQMLPLPLPVLRLDMEAQEAVAEGMTPHQWSCGLSHSWMSNYHSKLIPSDNRKCEPHPSLMFLKKTQSRQSPNKPTIFLWVLSFAFIKVHFKHHLINRDPQRSHWTFFAHLLQN